MVVVLKLLLFYNLIHLMPQLNNNMAQINKKLDRLLPNEAEEHKHGNSVSKFPNLETILNFRERKRVNI